VIESLIEMQRAQPVAETAAQGEMQGTPAERGRSSAPIPAWLAEERTKPSAEPAAPVEETLQQSRERVASRWFALRELFEQGPQEKAPEVKKAASGEVPVLAVFSLAGGVGKTSLVATLGRALSSAGEKVLLTDTTSHGLLPFYFGASELRPGVVRTFSPPVGSADAPIHLLSFDLLGKGGDLEAQEWLAEELTRNGQGMQRVLVDLSPSVPWVLKRIARMNSIVIVPMAPDMSSVISLNMVERFFADVTDANGKAVHPRYVLNGFDASQPLHLDVREVLRQQLGDRLLPFVIRRSPAVSEALAEGMTVMDYAPETPVAGDVLNLASWLRTQAAPAAGFRKARWSEQ
jgi:cellulose synthase operon protein YhjQ